MKCRYCENIFSKPFTLEPGVQNRILFESEHFVAVPTLGALVQGWLLIVSKRHRICMGDLDPSLLEEMVGFKNRVARVVEFHYGSVAVFEHGPSKPNQALGCGVDHAHLHIVPTECNLITGLSNIHQNDVLWQDSEGIQDAAEYHAKGFEYLYIEQPTDKALIAKAHGFGSQLFRKVIAQHIGKPEWFDWKVYEGAKNIRLTIEKLTSEATRRDFDLIVDKVVPS